MSTKTLKTNNAGLFGKKLNLPIAGEVEISKEGTIEVSEEVADLLVNRHDGTFKLAGEDAEVEVKETKVKETKVVTPAKVEAETETETKTETEEEEEDEEEELDLEALELEQLIELAKEAGFKEPTYRKFKKDKKLMIAFLKKNA